MLRAVARLPAALKLLAAGSKNSAEARSVVPLLPPITMTVPSGKVVAVALARGADMAGPGVTLPACGS